MQTFSDKNFQVKRFASLSAEPFCQSVSLLLASPALHMISDTTKVLWFCERGRFPFLTRVSVPHFRVLLPGLLIHSKVTLLFFHKLFNFPKLFHTILTRSCYICRHICRFECVLRYFKHQYTLDVVH